MIGIKLYILAAKLKRLYYINNKDGKIDYVGGLCGKYFLFHDLYDYLTTQHGFDIKPRLTEKITLDEFKKQLWKRCKIEAEIEHNYRILNKSPLWSMDDKKEYAIKLYKSELTYLYLVQMYNIDGQQLWIRDEENKIIPVLNWNQEYEDGVKTYLEQKTVNLMI